MFIARLFGFLLGSLEASTQPRNLGTKMEIGDKIIEVAEQFEGLVEIVSNTKWDDLSTPGHDARADKLIQILKYGGHVDGAPYCASGVEGVWKVAYEDQKASTAILAQISQILTPHVLTSYRNALSANLVTKTPKKGAIGFMRNGNTSNGHAFLFIDMADSKTMNTIEFNTSPSAKDIAQDRDGGIGLGGVWRKRRTLDFAPTSGLWLMGFMNPLPLQ